MIESFATLLFLAAMPLTTILICVCVFKLSEDAGLETPEFWKNRKKILPRKICYAPVFPMAGIAYPPATTDEEYLVVINTDLIPGDRYNYEDARMLHKLDDHQRLFAAKPGALFYTSHLLFVLQVHDPTRYETTTQDIQKNCAFITRILPKINPQRREKFKQYLTDHKQLLPAWEI